MLVRTTVSPVQPQHTSRRLTMKMRFLTTGVAGGTLTLALLFAGVNTSNAAPQHSPTAQAPAAPAKPPTKGAKKEWRVVFRDLLRATRQLTKLTPVQLKHELVAGKSLAQIAQVKGIKADALIASARTKLNARLKQAVTNKKITQAQADQRLARFDQEAPQIVNQTNVYSPKTTAQGRAFGRKLQIDAVAAATGLTTQQVVAEMKAGKSLEEITREHAKTTGIQER